MTTQEIIARLEGVKKTTTGWAAKCPAHDDNTPSLTITEGSDGKTLVNCHRGCSFDAVVASLGLHRDDFSQKRPHANNGTSKIVATYDYLDEAGVMIYQVVRKDPKDFRQRRPDPVIPGHWHWNMAGITRVLYRLPEVIAARDAGEIIFVVEGEKDADTLAAAGLVATCNAGGAGKWSREYTAVLEGAKRVVIIADKDKPGRDHAQNVLLAIEDRVEQVQEFECPDRGGAVKDVTDWFKAGGTAAELLVLIDAPAPAAPLDLSMSIHAQILVVLLEPDVPASKKKTDVASLVVRELAKFGRFYFHSDLRDFDSAMFFNSDLKRLERIRSDGFCAWLSGWLKINRADALFKFIIAEVETAALSSKHTTGILPESFWASRPGAVYLSNSDGSLYKITPGNVALCDNGTDGILFPVGRTLAPWALCDPIDPFTCCLLFAGANYAAPYGLDLMRLWLYSLPSNPKSKPALCLTGDVGSGKTRLLKGVAELYGIPFIAQKVQDDGEDSFWPAMNQGGLLILDNADTRCKWLPDALSSASTDGCHHARKLYTNDETVTLGARSWVGVTSANPTFANDPGLADRILVVRMNRRSGVTDDSALSTEIASFRDAALSHIAQAIAAALADQSATPQALNLRHPDFASLAVKLGRALSREPQAVTALSSAELDKSAFCVENDPVSAALLAYLNSPESGGRFDGPSSDLAPILSKTDPDLHDRLSPRRLSKKLASIWPHLAKIIPVAEKYSDRRSIIHFKFAISTQDLAPQFQYSNDP